MTDTKTITPTVIPAQPGFRLATLSFSESAKASGLLALSDIDVYYKNIIAWIVHPHLNDEDGIPTVSDAGVYVITPDGIEEGNDTYIVAPDGTWSRLHGSVFASDMAARKDFLKNYPHS